jgi:hypothetical protein
MTALLGAAFHSGETLPSPVRHIDFHRFFFPPGGLSSPQKWSDQKPLVAAHDKYGARAFLISVKPDQVSNATAPMSATAIKNIGSFFDTVPADSKANTYVSFYHEHDGNIRDGSLKIGTYKAGSKQIADVVHSKGLKYGPLHNGVNRQYGTSGAWGLWPDIWKQNEADVSLYDFWAADCYSTNYEAPSPRMNPLKTYADSLGLPLLVGEMAAPITDPAKQAAWAKPARAWALANAKYAAWWSSQVSSTDPDYRLSDQAAKVWFGLV